MTMIEPNLIGGLTGGILIGLASVLLLITTGRIAGISGILAGIYGKWTAPESWWRIVFLSGLIAGTALVAFIHGELNITLQAQGPTLIIAGLLVGFGTRLGGGCTSGHGVCGLALRSRRAFTATLIFMLVAILTVFILRHILA